jgi:hypothetical protein
MNPALTTLLIAARIVLWIFVTGLFYFFMKDARFPPTINLAGCVLLFFVAYLITPRIAFLDRALGRS